MCAGDGKGRGEQIVGQIVDDLGLRARLVGEQGRQFGPEGPEQGRHDAHAQRGDDDHLQGDALCLGGLAHAETVAHQHGDAHVEGVK